MSKKQNSSTAHGDAVTALSSPRSDEYYDLFLFISGSTPNSLRAIANVRQMCELRLADRHSLTIVDLYQEAELAVREQIIAAPTLLRKKPLPIKRLIGDLANADRILLNG